MMKAPSLKAGILTIGNEVLDGLILDTNANWIEQQLVKLGVEMRCVVSVRDEVEEIGQGLAFLMERCDFVITSGGLGPTHDDMTLLSIAKSLERELVLNPKGLEIVSRQYEMLYEKGMVQSPNLTESRRKMAILPEGAIALDNTVGGAPGVMLNQKDRTIFCLPGVPAELKDIWESGVKPWVLANTIGAYYQEIVDFEVVDESILAPHIKEAMKENPDVWIKSMPKRYGTTRIMRVWISSRGEEMTLAQQRVKIAIHALERISGLHSYLPETKD
ncbi:MAG: molybdopterin-binding protein [Candidatus Thorarchaeota archaeon]